MAVDDPFAGLIDSLPKSQRASYGFIRSLADQEPSLSANEALSQLQAAGWGINRQAFLGIYATLKSKADIPTFINTFGDNAIFPNSVHTIGTYPFKSGHKVVYEVGTNSTNDLIPKSVYVGSQAPLSANEIYAGAAAQFTYEQGSGLAPGDLNDVVFTIDDSRYSPGLQTTGEFEPPPEVTAGFESFTPSGVEAGITKAYNQALADLKAGKITGPEFFQRTRGL